jgi:hypothetical protein
MNYEPEVNDYVIWQRESWTGITIDEGWVYFKAPIFEERNGFKIPNRYITIETAVFDKPYNHLPPSNGKPSRNPHQKTHSLLLCYQQSWKDLKFIKRRESPIVQHYSQYDDRT